jgi:hypothetical protein
MRGRARCRGGVRFEMRLRESISFGKVGRKGEGGKQVSPLRQTMEPFGSGRDDRFVGRATVMLH